MDMQAIERALSNATGINETTPTVISDDIRRYAAIKSPGNEPVLIPVRPVAEASPKECYGNVELQIRQSGGEIVYGWLIFEASGMFLNFIHHSVWRSPDGELVCVSPQDEEAICFLSDSKRPYDGRFIAGGLYELTEERNVRDYCNLTNNLLTYFQMQGNPNIVDDFVIRNQLRIAEICQRMSAQQRQQ